MVRNVGLKLRIVEASINQNMRSTKKKKNQKLWSVYVNV